MSDRERLHEIVETLPVDQVQAWLAILEGIGAISDQEFARRLAEASEEEVDPETAARMLAAEAEAGVNKSCEDLKRRLGI